MTHAVSVTNTILSSNLQVESIAFRCEVDHGQRAASTAYEQIDTWMAEHYKKHNFRSEQQICNYFT